MSALDRVLRPASVAVLGASSKPGALSGRFLSGLRRHGFDGRVVPVNPRGGEIEGYEAATSLAEAGEIDLVVISLPRDAVLDGMKACAAAGVAGAVLFTSGFSEAGGDGAARERELAAVARDGGFRLLGPNSPGFINVADRTCVIASGAGFREALVGGGIAVVSQSGGAAGLLAERLQDAGAGISIAVCTGNEADVGVAEVLRWLARHEPTRAVALFLEGLRAPGELADALDEMHAAGKPVAAIKAGGTEAAARATAAHTGALAGEDVVAGAFLERHHVARVHGFAQLADTTVALERLGRAAGRRVGILSTSGGAGVVATEAAERAGLELPPLAPATTARLEGVLPDFAALDNPADMSGMFAQDPEIFRTSVHAFTDAEEFDTAVLVLTVHPPEPSERLADLILAADAPGLAVLWTAGAMSAPARQRLAEAGLAVFEEAEGCMRALAARAEERSEGAPLPPVALSLPEGAATEAEALALLEEAGVPVVHSIACAEAGDAALAAEALARPVAVKASARDLAHKGEAGAVVIGVSGGAEAAHAHDRVVAAARAAGATPEGSIVQPLAPSGHELIVGARHSELGTVVVVGPGGAAAETGAGTVSRLLPLRTGEAAAMLTGLGVDSRDAVAAVEGLARVADALGDRLEALEVNPLIVAGDSAVAVDALLLLHDG